MQDSNPGISWLNGLTEYGPVGIMLALSMLALGYAFKRLFDRALDEAKATGPKLDAIQQAVSSGLIELRNEIREMRHEMMLAMAQRQNEERTPAPIPRMPSLPVRRGP